MLSLGGSGLFKSFSVKWKIYTIAIVSLIGFAGYLAFNVWINNNNFKILADIRDVHFPVLSMVEGSREQMDRINELYNTSVTIAEEDYAIAAEEGTEAVFDYIDDTILLVPHDAGSLKEIKALFKDYSDQANGIAMGMINETIDFAKLPEQATKKEEAFATATAALDTYIKSALDNFTSSVEIANQNSKTLLRTGFVIWVVNVVVLTVMAYAIARLILTNIINVSTSLDEISKGRGDLDKVIQVRSNDEIGQLAVSFNALMGNLREKTNDLMSMMQNMHQGLFTIMSQDGKHVIHPEYSSFIESIFETKEVADVEYQKLLLSKATLGSDQTNRMLMAVQEIIDEDKMMFELNAHLLPREIILKMADRRKTEREDDGTGGRLKILEIDWDPIVSDDVVTKLMVTVRDVTQLRAAAQEAQAQKEELEMIGEILKVPKNKFLDFLESADVMLEKNRTLISGHSKKDLDVVADLFVNMHTIKGNSRTYDFQRAVNVVHDAESTYDRLRKDNSYLWDQAALLFELDQVVDAIASYRRIGEEKLNISPDQRVEGLLIDDKVYENLLEDCAKLSSLFSPATAGAEYAAFEYFTRGLKQLGCQPISEVISGITESLSKIAQQLDKAPPIVKIEDGQVLIKRQYFEAFVNVFTHLLRNSLDHGIETREVRKQKGKHAQGTIDVNVIAPSVDSGAGEALVIIKDDGKGLALNHLKEKFKETHGGLFSKVGSLQEVAQLIFESGVSTAQEVTDISGRGVGMDAVRKLLNAEGADITIKVDESVGLDAEFLPFELHITLQPSMFVLLS